MKRILAILLAILFITPLLACGSESVGADRVQDLVSAEPYPKLRIHVDYVEERRPRDTVRQRLAGGLTEVIDKPGGIDVVVGDVLPAQAPSSGWTFSQLRELVEPRARALRLPRDTVAAYTLFVDGSFNHGGSGTVLGVAWGNRYTVIFKDEIERACRSGAGLLPALNDQLCENAELTVWRHEIGHVLGLVNTGAPLTSDHADPNHPSHCKHDHCVMYWAFRGTGAIDILRDRLVGGDSSVPDFDASCRADLEALMR